MRWWIAPLCALALPVAALAAGPDCLPAPHDQPEGEAQVYLAGLLEALTPSLARAPQMAQSLAELAPALCLDDALYGAEGYFEPDTMRIVLRRGLGRDLHLGILLHELRHLDQFRRGFCPSDDLSMIEHARAVFALEADASAVSLLLAWQRLLDGDPAVWEALLNWPSQTDIAIALGRAYFESAGAPAMAAAAFAQWYEDDARRERYYLSSCAAYLDRQDLDHRLPADGVLPAEFPSALCVLPSGLPYPCAEPVPMPARAPRPDPPPPARPERWPGQGGLSLPGRSD